MRALRFAFAFSLALAASTGGTVAHAQESGAMAEQYFRDGRKQMEAKNYVEACRLFAASQKASPAVGTLLNLADCYEKNKQYASAWARFHEAVALAQRNNRPDREKTAKDRADKLEGLLIRLKITSVDSNVDVKLDGTALDSNVLGTAVPVDPGKHTIEATAKGKKGFTTTLDVSERNKSPAVEIPALEKEPEAVKDPDKKDPDKKDPDKKDPDKVAGDPNAGKTQRIIGLVGVGVGVVGVGLGTVFGLRTSSQWKDAQTHCTGLECDRTGVDLASRAKNAGTVSTISFIAGGVFLAGGLALFLTAPSPSKDVKVGIGLGEIQVKGSF